LLEKTEITKSQYHEADTIPIIATLFYTTQMPRIEYTLSFENYLEMTSSRRGKPKYRAALISALIGFFFVAAGYTYLRIWPETWPVIGGSLLGLGLLTTGLALALAFFAKPKTSRPDMTTLRREYDRFFSDKRAIDFDENGWRVFWYEGEDLRPWSCVKEIHDLKTLLILVTETTYYWLPKVALEREGQLANIKALAETALTNRRLLFKVPMRPSAFVYVVAKLSHNWRRQFTTRLLCYLAATLVVYWVVFSDADGTKPHSQWLLALAPVLLIFCESLYYFRKYFLANWSEAAREAEIMSDCVGYKTDSVRWIAGYRRLLESREVPGAFLLYFDPQSFHLIPKKGFSPDQLVTFRELLASSRQ